MPSDEEIRRLERERDLGHEDLLELCKAKERLDGAAEALETAVSLACAWTNRQRRERRLTPQAVALAMSNVVNGAVYGIADGAAKLPGLQRKTTGFSGPSTITFIGRGDEGAIVIGFAEAEDRPYVLSAVADVWPTLSRVTIASVKSWVAEAQESDEATLVKTNTEVARRWVVLGDLLRGR